MLKINLLLFSFFCLFTIQTALTQTVEVETVNTTSFSNCDGMATLINAPSSPWTWEWFSYDGSMLQSGGTTLTNLCHSGVAYYIVFSASGQTSYNTYFYIYDNCFNVHLSVGSVNTASDECTGFIIGYPEGGIPPYSFDWSNGSTNDVLSLLCAGDYSFTLTDSQGCIDTGTIPILVDSALSSVLTIHLFSITNDDISPECTGSIQLQPEGGAAPYTFNWSNNNNNYGNDSLCPGVYTITISDASGDSISETYPIYNGSVIYTSNPFPDSTIISNFDFGLIEDCTIDFASIDTAYLYTSFLDTLNQQAIFTWLIVDALDSTFYSDTINSFVLNGVYNLVIGFYCSQKSSGQFIQIESYVYFGNNSIHTSSLDKNNFEGIDIYPNPFEDKLIIKSLNIGNYRVKLVDLNGKTLFEKDYHSTNKIQLEQLHWLDRGVYLLQIESENRRYIDKIIH
jgi:hypothetical protein